MKCKYCGKITKERKYSDCDFWVKILKDEKEPFIIAGPLVFGFQRVRKMEEEEFIGMLEDSFSSVKKRLLKQYRVNRNRWLGKKE